MALFISNSPNGEKFQRRLRLQTMFYLQYMWTDTLLNIPRTARDEEYQ